MMHILNFFKISLNKILVDTWKRLTQISKIAAVHNNQFKNFISYNCAYFQKNLPKLFIFTLFIMITHFKCVLNAIMSTTFNLDNIIVYSRHIKILIIISSILYKTLSYKHRTSSKHHKGTKQSLLYRKMLCFTDG